MDANRVCPGIHKVRVGPATRSVVATCYYTPGRGKIVPCNYTPGRGKIVACNIKVNNYAPGRGKIVPRNVITLLVGENCAA